MRIVVGCEESGTTRRAIDALGLGHVVWSVDMLPSRDDSPFHHTGDLFDFLDREAPFDLGIFHPECTYLSSSGLFRNLKDPVRAAKTEAALEFVDRIFKLPIPKKAIENPVGCISTRLSRPASQFIHPWQHGEKQAKTTGLWLFNLPLITPTKVMTADWCCEDGTRFPFELGARGCPTCGGARPALQRWDNQTFSGQNVLGPSKDRKKIRSKTYEGIARAWADQWCRS